MRLTQIARPAALGLAAAALLASCIPSLDGVSVADAELAPNVAFPIADVRFTLAEVFAQTGAASYLLVDTLAFDGGQLSDARAVTLKANVVSELGLSAEVQIEALDYEGRVVDSLFAPRQIISAATIRDDGTVAEVGLTRIETTLTPQQISAFTLAESLQLTFEISRPPSGAPASQLPQQRRISIQAGLSVHTEPK